MIKTGQPEFKFYEQTGISTCKLIYKNKTFIGKAKCHKDDQDMKSEKVGCEIAYYRAIIEALKYERDSIIKPSLKALRQLYYSMNRSKRFNSKSYENKMLWSQIYNWQLDLDAVNLLLATTREMLRNYIETKENLYKSVRMNRNRGQN